MLSKHDIGLIAGRAVREAVQGAGHPEELEIIAAEIRNRLATEVAEWWQRMDNEPVEDHPSLSAYERNSGEIMLKVLAVISAR